jgi:ATP-dependent DNA helicase PIF1
MSTLSKEQRYAFDMFCEGKNLLVAGSGGTGKSYLIENMVKHLNFINRNFQVTGLTGCCSVLLSSNIQINGKNLNVKTINSWAGIRLCKGDNEMIVSNVLKNKFLVKTWRAVRVLIIDEVSMLNCKMFNVLEEIARKTRKSERPFGGIQVVLIGDHLQLPPVADLNDIETTKFCFESERWYDVIPLENHVELKTIFRQKDQIFRNILNEVRIGELSQANKEILQSRVGVKYNPEDHNGIIPIEILPTRNQVSNTNNYQYDKIKGKEYTFNFHIVTSCNLYIENSKPISIEDEIKCKKLSVQGLEIEIKNLKSTVPVEDKISLKLGVPVMVLVNLDLEKSVCNGTLGIVIAFQEGYPLIRFSDGKERLIGPYTWQNSDFPSITIAQLPLTLSYASSIHKQQGASIEMARMNLGYSIFEDSQIYVALSRVTSLEGLFLEAFHAQKISVNKKAKAFYSSFPNILLCDKVDTSNKYINLQQTKENETNQFAIFNCIEKVRTVEHIDNI